MFFVFLFTILSISSIFIIYIPNSEKNNSLNPKISSSVPTGVFHSLYINHNFSFNGVPMGSSRFSYSHLSGNTYKAHWFIIGDLGIWDEDIRTRLTSNHNPTDPNFGSGTHTPIWIPTNTSLDEIVLISVDAEGDHAFNVTNELSHNFPGYGILNVWVLEHLVFPSAIVWYEKTTGILLNGTFVYSGGGLSYTFDFVSTNAFTYMEIPIPTGVIDGVIVKHNFSLSGGPAVESNFTYSHYSGFLFNVTWMEGGLTGRWCENIYTRLISEASLFPSFNDNSHTPVWIPTNISVSDLVIISVDGEGDHAFNVTRELSYKFPGVGTLNLWELQDLAFPGAVVWYEKTTGVLINGTFIFMGGMDFYTFDFIGINLNVVSKAAEEVIPGYNHYFLIGILCIVSVFIVKLKITKRKKN